MSLSVHRLSHLEGQIADGRVRIGRGNRLQDLGQFGGRMPSKCLDGFSLLLEGKTAGDLQGLSNGLVGRLRPEQSVQKTRDLPVPIGVQNGSSPGGESSLGRVGRRTGALFRFTCRNPRSQVSWGRLGPAPWHSLPPLPDRSPSRWRGTFQDALGPVGGEVKPEPNCGHRQKQEQPGGPEKRHRFDDCSETAETRPAGCRRREVFRFGICCVREADLT